MDIAHIQARKAQTGDFEAIMLLMAHAQAAIRTLGGKVEQVRDYRIPGTDVTHRLIFIKKVRKTDKKYPRAFAKIKKNPL